VAAPRNNAYSVESGGSVLAGLPRPVPLWVGGVGAWSAAPSSTLTSSGAGWAGASPGGAQNYAAIVNAWGGGVLNTVGIWRAGVFVPGVFLIIFGGGHGDYGGNELMGFGPINTNTPTWSRITDPTIPAPFDVPRNGAGYPVSRHTYDTLVYLPTVNRMLCVQATAYHNQGDTFKTYDLFDFNVNPASGNPWSEAVGGPTDAPPNWSMVDGLTGYDDLTGRAWYLGGGNVTRAGSYVAATGAWERHTILDNPDLTFDLKAGYSSALSIMAYVTSGGAVRAMDARGTPAVYTPSVTGTGPGVKCPVVEWDADGGRFVCWQGSGSTLYYLTPSATPYAGGAAWAWSSQTFSGTGPANQTPNGTFGRGRMARIGTSRGLLLMPIQNAPIVFARMA
jgi:hypothetical protein